MISLRKIVLMGGWLIFMPMVGLQASQKIEILSGHKKFSSFEKYKKYRQQALAPDSTQQEKETTAQESDSSAFNSFIAQEKHPEEFSFDPQKVKTILVKSPASEAPSQQEEDKSIPAHLSAKTHERLKDIDMTTPVKENIKEFVDNPSEGQGKRLNVFQEDLEGLLQSTAGSGNDPQLYMMDEYRLRVMGLTTTSDEKEHK